MSTFDDVKMGRGEIRRREKILFPYPSRLNSRLHPVMGHLRDTEPIIDILACFLDS